MYDMRFPDEDTSGLTMQQLRGREGARVRKVYRAHAARTGVPWERREYDPTDFDDGTPVPGLGFVHTGHIRSFVYDIADLHKTQISIPIAFDIAAREVADIGAETRRTVRDHMKDGAFLETCVRDIKTLLADETDEVEYGPDAFEDPDVVMLWDCNGRTVAGGTSYGDDE